MPRNRKARAVTAPAPRQSPHLQRLALAAIALCLPLSGEAIAAGDGPVFDVERFSIEYGTTASDLPEITSLVPVQVQLGLSASGWVDPLSETATSKQILHIGDGTHAGKYHASAIAAVSRGVLERVREHGFVGVFVKPHPADIDIHTERDLRPYESGPVRLIVEIGRVRELRSIASGGRIPENWKINNPAHRKIRTKSPIQPSALVRADTTDVIRKRELEDYLFRVNRYPGRRAEASLAGAKDGDGVALDFQVHEAKPWFVYLQSSDTGTERTSVWQQRIGFVHRQATGNDDIFSFQYTNAGIDQLNAFTVSYDAPWFGADRPEWAKSQPDEAIWQKALFRDWLPWWGSDKIRWNTSFSYNDFKATDVSGIDDLDGNELNLSSRITYQAFQYRNFFVDLFAGHTLRKVDVQSQTTLTEGDEFFYLPVVGFEAERIQETSTFVASANFETNLSGVNRKDLNNLGRRQVANRWKVFHYNVGSSFYLEPLLFPEDWKDPSTPSTSTLSHEVSIGFRGQQSLNDRLPAQAMGVVGGAYSVRGYDQSIASGDHILVASAEYRFHVPRILPIQPEPLNIPLLGDFRAAPQMIYGRPDWDFIIKGFIDYGQTKRVQGSHPTQPLAYEPGDKLLGAGAGVEFRYKHHVTVRADWGRVLKRPNDRHVKVGDNRFHLLFSVLY